MRVRPQLIGLRESLYRSYSYVDADTHILFVLNTGKTSKRPDDMIALTLFSIIRYFFSMSSFSPAIYRLFPLKL